MSIEAMSWALNTQVGDPVAKLVLIGLASHARADGTAAWPAKSALARYAGVTTRTVVSKLQALEERGLISLGDQRLTAYMRADRRPRVWDLEMPRGEDVSPREDDYRRGEANVSPRKTARREATVSPRSEPRGETGRTNGVKTVSPKTSLKPSIDKDSLRSSLSARPRATRLNPDWIPEPELIAEMRAECPTIDLQAEHRKFVDYWCSKSGRDATKIDWGRTWRNWIRNAKPTNGNGRPRNQQETETYLARALADAQALDKAQARKELNA